MELPDTGLSKEEVLERRRAGLANITTVTSSRSVGKIISSNLLTYFNFIFLIITVLLISAGSALRNFTFLPIVIANSLISIIQELRAKKVLDQLSILNAPTARVIREGKLIEVPVSELVQDDIVFLKNGDQVSADAEVLSGEISVNESLLTGEPDEITKSKNHPLLSGSFITQGECYARLTKVGNASYASELTLRAKAIKTGEQSEIIKGLNKFVRIAGIVLIPLGAIMLAQQLIQGSTYSVAIEAMVAALLGLIPEGLFLLASATLVLSAMRLARQKVLLHDMKSIETLARADVLCVDKTGTITTGKMKVKETIWLKDQSDAATFLAAMIHSQSADSETMIALKKAFKSVKSRPAPRKIQGFSSRLKYSGADFGDSGTFVVGAPELVLRENLAPLRPKLESISTLGLRVLIFAKYAGPLENKPLSAAATPLAIIVIEDEIRKSAPKTFAYLQKQGISVKIISGDSPLTASAIGQRVGIPGAEHHRDLSKPLSDAALAEVIQTTTVFGRVSPADKRRLIQAFQAAGHTVAMTGDGVNDVLALKDADCSIAMASGTQAAAGAAQMVLLDSDFSRMLDVISEGRRVVNNIERSGSLFIIKNLFSFAISMLTIIFGVIYPLVPAQVSLISLWAIGIPAFFLAQIPEHKLIKGNFMKNILKAALPTAVTAILLVAISAILSRLANVPAVYHGTICAYVWGAVALIHLFRIAYPYNIWSFIICCGCLVGMLLSVLLGPSVFALSRGLGLREWLIVASLSLVAYPLITINSKIIKASAHVLFD